MRENTDQKTPNADTFYAVNITFTLLPCSHSHHVQLTQHNNFSFIALQVLIRRFPYNFSSQYHFFKLRYGIYFSISWTVIVQFTACPWSMCNSQLRSTLFRPQKNLISALPLLSVLLLRFFKPARKE